VFLAEFLHIHTLFWRFFNKKRAKIKKLKKRKIKIKNVGLKRLLHLWKIRRYDPSYDWKQQLKFLVASFCAALVYSVKPPWVTKRRNVLLTFDGTQAFNVWCDGRPKAIVNERRYEHWALPWKDWCTDRTRDRPASQAAPHSAPRDARWKYFTLKYLKILWKFLDYFKTPSLKYFMKFLIFIIKWLKTFKTWLNYICRPKPQRIMRQQVHFFGKSQKTFEIFKKFMEIFEIFQDPFLKYFTKFLIFIIRWLKTLKTWLKYKKLVGNT